MEYEIDDQGEYGLFDDSTNPSLQLPSRHHEADSRKLQRAELIPEEEEQLS